MRDGEPVVYVERGGKGLRRLADLDMGEMGEAMTALAAAVEDGTLPKLGIERIDGEPVIGSGLEDVLVTAGFARGPRRLVAAAGQR
jgi:ATP-dependent Lhr-like helicase